MSTRPRLASTLQCAALLLSALTMGLEFAHVLEWPAKASYPAALYVRLQESLYVLFGNLGGPLYVAAILTTVVLAVLLRRDPRRRAPVIAAAVLEVLALGCFFALTYPVNLRLPVHGGGAVPPDLAGLRTRWELGHTLGFVLFTSTFLLQCRCRSASAMSHGAVATPDADPSGTDG
ncbi:MAG: hypothetical protein ACRDRL_22695 [Sciscionella sp.]